MQTKGFAVVIEYGLFAIQNKFYGCRLHFMTKAPYLSFINEMNL